VEVNQYLSSGPGNGGLQSPQRTEEEVGETIAVYASLYEARSIFADSL
jgi:hypothetical protein